MPGGFFDAHRSAWATLVSVMNQSDKQQFVMRCLIAPFDQNQR